MFMKKIIIFIMRNNKHEMKREQISYK